MSFSLVSGQGKNIWIGKFSKIPKGFIHGISTRYGGISHGFFDSMNLGLHVQDEKEAVVANRSLFCKALGVDQKSIVTCQQVHGAEIVKVTREMAGSGSEDFSNTVQGADALVTNEPGIPLMLFFADCTPILLVDPVKKVIGLAHGGWKGTVASIGAKTVQKMKLEYGSRPEDMVAAIGPAIGPCCYEVGVEVAEQFIQRFSSIKNRILTSKTNGRYQLNLWEANRLQLQGAGLLGDSIDMAGVCTCCNNRQFFSYRAENGKCGRIAALLCIKE